MRVATTTIRSTPILHAMRAQGELAQASTEMTTGRLADPGLTLRAGAARPAALDASIAGLRAGREANAHARTMLGAMETSLEAMRGAADALTAGLLTSTSVGTDAARAHAAAEAAGLLASVAGHVNVAVGGAHPFGGERSGTLPLADPVTDAAARMTIEDAFAATFGHAIDNPATVTIGPAAMAGFIDGLEAGFPTIYATRWAGDAPGQRALRPAPGEVVRVPVTAHDPGVRDLVLAASLGAAFADAPLGGEARAIALDHAVAVAGRARGGLDAASGGLGLVAERLTRADGALAARETVAAQALAGMVNVDPAEAAARVQALAAEVEASLAITARVSRLSLLNYL